MKLKSPSPKVLAFLVLTILLITVVILSSKFIKSNDQEINQVDLTIENQLQNSINKELDSDNDGLPDWQEEIWGTDKNNPDTDGDGTSDGEEIRLNRNPLIPTPGDEMLSEKEFTQQIIDEISSGEESDPNSVTSILSKNLLMQVAQMSQYGIEGDDQQLTNDLINQALSQMNIPDKYPESLFFAFDSKEPEKIQEYAQKLFNTQWQEMLSISADNKNLDPIITSFKNIAFQMSIMAVPKEVVSLHSKIANNYYIAAEALINLKISNKDPILGLLSIPIYKKVSEDQSILLQQLQNYFDNNNIAIEITEE